MAEEGLLQKLEANTKINSSTYRFMNTTICHFVLILEAAPEQKQKTLI